VTATALRRSGPAELRLAALVLGLAAAAWVLTVNRMAGMDAGPGTALGGVGWFAVSWLVMMAAMMLPAMVPMVVAYGRRADTAIATALFVVGYLGAWLAAGLAAYAAIEGVRSLGPGLLAWDVAGRYLAAGVIAAAGVYQLTGCKFACLRRCRDRVTFLREHWRPGGVGAVRMGVGHGGYCVGSTWAIMAALFALGAMSLTWMAVLAALVAAERLLSRNARLGVALVLVALGAGVAVAPADVPGLTVPGATPMRTMEMP
jgi:predicted metal-binding membrane protein